MAQTLKVEYVTMESLQNALWIIKTNKKKDIKQLGEDEGAYSSSIYACSYLQIQEVIRTRRYIEKKKNEEEEKK